MVMTARSKGKCPTHYTGISHYKCLLLLLHVSLSLQQTYNIKQKNSNFIKKNVKYLIIIEEDILQMSHFILLFFFKVYAHIFHVHDLDLLFFIPKIKVKFIFHLIEIKRIIVLISDNYPRVCCSITYQVLIFVTFLVFLVYP